jgi:hypothetical protein
MEQPNAFTNELQISINIAAAPAVSFSKNGNALPIAGPPPTNEGFRINLVVAVPYASLSRVLNGLLAGKRFELSEGLMATYIIVQNAAVSADVAGNLLIKVQFSGSFGGIVYFKGKPVYDETSQTLRVANMRYELQSQSLLLNTAKWLFSNKIESELKKRTQFPLAQILESARTTIQNGLNKEWATGIAGQGKVGDLRLEEIAVLPEHLYLKCHCDGKLVIQFSNFDLKIKG